MIIDEVGADVRLGGPGRAARWLRSRRVRVVAIAAALGVSLIAALAVAGQGPIPIVLQCADVTRLTRHPTDPVFTGAALGPLMLRDFAPSASRALIDTYHEGFPEQVVLIAARPYDHLLSLSGWRCADGRPLRFSLAYPFLPPSPPAPSSLFVLTGENSAFIRPFPTLPDAGVVGPEPPWFLFDSAGRWVIELRDGEELIGRVTLEVQVAR